MLSRIGRWFHSIALRSRLEREMQEEMQSHLGRATERLVARGMMPDAARLAAKKEFGNVAQLQEAYRRAHPRAKTSA